MIRITSKLHGVEVAGMRHPAKTVHYTDDQITDEQLAEMSVSAYLTVELDGDSAGRTIASMPQEVTDSLIDAQDKTGDTTPAADVADAVAEGTAAMEGEKTADDVNAVDVATEQAEAEIVANAQSEPEQPAKRVKTAKTKK